MAREAGGDHDYFEVSVMNLRTWLDLVHQLRMRYPMLGQCTARLTVETVYRLPQPSSIARTGPSELISTGNWFHFFVLAGQVHASSPKQTAIQVGISQVWVAET